MPALGLTVYLYCTFHALCSLECTPVDDRNIQYICIYEHAVTNTPQLGTVLELQPVQTLGFRAN